MVMKKAAVYAAFGLMLIIFSPFWIIAGTFGFLVQKLERWAREIDDEREARRQ